MTYLWKNFQVSVDIDESGWKMFLLHHQKIDRALIPEEKLTGFLNPLLFHITTYEDEKGNEWFFALASHLEDVFHLYHATYLERRAFYELDASLDVQMVTGFVLSSQTSHISGRIMKHSLKMARK